MAASARFDRLAVDDGPPSTAPRDPGGVSARPLVEEDPSPHPLVEEDPSSHPLVEEGRQARLETPTSNRQQLTHRVSRRR